MGVASPVSEIILPLKNGQMTMDYSPWSSKNFIDWNWLKKFMQIGLDEHTCTPILEGIASPVLEIMLPLKNDQISLSDHGLYSPWSSKTFIDRNRLKKIMQIGLDVTCMYTDFGGHSLSSFRDNNYYLSKMAK